MAVAFTARASIGATGTTVTTASFTPSANSRLFAFCGSRTSAGVPPVVTDSLGGTWTLITGSDINSGSANGSFRYIDIGASPVAMTVTATSTAAGQTGIQVFDVTGHDTSVANYASGTNANGDPSLTLSAMSTGSFGVAAAVFNAAGSAPTTVPSGYTSVYQALVATNLRMCLYTDATSPGVTQSWATTGTDSIAYGLEIKEASSGSVSVNVTGQALTTEVGDVTVTAVAGGNISVDVTGQEISASSGTVAVTAVVNVSVDVTGETLTASVGTATVSIATGVIGAITSATPAWGAAAAPATSASFTAAAGTLLIVLINGRGANATIPTISDSLGETWTGLDAGTDSGNICTRLFWKISTGAAQTITASSTLALQVGAVCASIPGAGTDFSNYKKHIISGVGTTSVTMDAFSTDSACAYFYAASAGANVATVTGYTEVYDGEPATNTRLVWGFDQVANTPAISITGTGADAALYAVELKLPLPAGFVIAYPSGQGVTISVGDATVTAVQNVSADAGSQLVTTAVGDVTVETAVGAINVDVDVAGHGLTVSVGDETVVGKANVNAATNLVTVSVGDETVVGKANVSVTGESASLTTGGVSVTAGGSVSVGISGNEVTAESGIVTVRNVGIAQALGQGLVVSAGDETVVGKANVTVVGEGISVTAGTATVLTAGVNVSVPVTTNLVTVSAGTVTVGLGRSVAVTGHQIAVSSGTVSVSGKTSVAVTGTELAVELDYVEAQVGSVVAVTTAGLMTVSVGTTGISIASTYELTGTEAAIFAGTVATEFDYVFELLPITGMTLYLGHANCPNWGEPGGINGREDWTWPETEGAGDWIPVPGSEHQWQKSSPVGDEGWSKQTHQPNEWH